MSELIINFITTLITNYLKILHCPRFLEMSQDMGFDWNCFCMVAWFTGALGQHKTDVVYGTYFVKLHYVLILCTVIACCPQCQKCDKKNITNKDKYGNLP